MKQERHEAMDEKKKNMEQDVVVTVSGDITEEQNRDENMTLAPAMTQSAVVVFPYALTPLVLDNPENILDHERRQPQ
jgi:hypothetical protein